MNDTSTGQTTDQRGVSHVGCNGALGGRAKRRIEAEERRRAWRLAWNEKMRQHLRDGRTTREAVYMLADDVAELRTQNPQLGSEVDRALEEFLQSLSSAVARHAATPPNTEMSGAPKNPRAPSVRATTKTAGPA